MSDAAPFRIRNAVLPSGEGPKGGSVSIAKGHIVALDDSGEGEAIDAGGKLLIPGLIDLGVFAIDKPASHFGGITRAALMPDQSPPLDLPSRIAYVAKSGKPGFWVHPLAAATRTLAGAELSELGLMQAEGARGIATGRGWIADSAVMLRVLRYAAMLDLPVIAHAEDAALIGDAVATAGEIATRLGLPAAPSEAEAIAIARDVALAEMAGAHVHFRQVTTRAGLDFVRTAKKRGLRVTAGVTPAHFMLSDLALADFRSFLRLSPPLRREDDRLAVREALADGTIDVIASGHDPRGPEEKRLPFADAAPGMIGAQTLLALVLSLVRDGVLSLERAVALVTQNPADLLKVPAGRIAVGAEADLALVDPNKPWIVQSEEMGAGNTPFDGQGVQGRVLRLWKGGAQVL